MSNNTFFCGNSVHGHAKRAAANNFNEFVDRYLTTPIPLKVTRAEYATLGKNERKEAKKVPYFTAAQFATSPSARQTTLATSCSMVNLDIDEAQPAIQILSNLAHVKAQLDGLNYAIYHTTSSTPDHPRLRIVVEADALPLKHYPAAVHTLQRMLNLQLVDPSSDRMVQPMYRPSRFKDEPNYQPLVATATNGSPFLTSMVDISVTRPSATPNPSAPAAEPDEDALDHLRNPVDDISLATVSSTLSHLDPDMDYASWLSVAAGLKHQFYRTSEEEEAFDLFNNWSAQGQKYTTVEETRAKWDSFAYTPKGRAPATFRSVLHMAKEAGYTPPPQPTSTPKTLSLAQKQSTATSAPDLISITLDHLAQLNPQPSNADQAVVLSELARALKVLFKVTITPAALKRDLRAKQTARHAQQYALQRANATAENDGEFPVPEWVAPFIYISATEQFYNKDTGVSYSARAFNATFSRELTPTAEQVDDPAQLSRPRVLPTDYATNEIRIPVVVDFLYSPAHPPSSVIEEDGSLYINTYKPSYAPADASTATICGNVIETHLANIISDPEYQRTLLDWMAFQVQHPGVKVRWAPVIIGGQGTGKTLIGQMLGAAIGSTNIRTVEGKSLVSPFHNWAVGSQVITLEEVRVHGTSRHQIMDTLKPLISNERIDLVRKNRDNTCVRNVTNYIIFSNARDALMLDDSTRRYHICMTKQWTASEVATLGGASYFAPIYKLLNDHPGGFRAYLLGRTIDHATFDPNIAPKRTAATEDMVEQSACEHTIVMREAIHDGDNPLIRKDLIAVAALTEAWIASDGCSNRVSFKYASFILKTEGYERLGRYLIEGKQHSLWLRRGEDPERDWVEIARQRIQRAYTDVAQECFPDSQPTRTLQQDIDDLL